MRSRVGNIIYLIACILAAPLAILSLYHIYRFAIGLPDPFNNFTYEAAAITVLVWGSGWAARYVLCENKSTKPRL